MGVVVESTSHGYGLVDGGMAAGSRVHLATPAALPPSNGLQSTDAHSAARGLAPVGRLGGCPAGDLSPKAARAVRAVGRQRAPLVRQPTAQRLSVQTLRARTTGARFRAKRLVERTPAALQGLRPEAAPVLAVTSRRAVVPCLGPQSQTLEQTVPTCRQPPPA